MTLLDECWSRAGSVMVLPRPPASVLCCHHYLSVSILLSDKSRNTLCLHLSRNLKKSFAVLIFSPDYCGPCGICYFSAYTHSHSFSVTKQRNKEVHPALPSETKKLFLSAI